MSSALRASLPSAILLLALGLSTAHAQTAPPDPWEQARWRFGPLAVTPSIVLNNLGIDTNVFNQATEPKQDFTAAVAPQADWWLRLGRARLRGTEIVEGVYFAKYSSETALNYQHEGTFELLLNRFRPYVGASYLDSKNRSGYEIDARARHTDIGLKAGAVVRLGSRASVNLGATRVDYEYTGDDLFLGTSLARQLNRRTENYGATLSLRVTPLTTITLLADGVRERFSESPERNNDGYRILPGVEFDPLALLKGKATVGYRSFNMIDPSQPDYSGPVWSAALSFTLLGTTRIGVGTSRDIVFSYEFADPIYVQTGYDLSVTQSIGGPWDLQARGGWFKLAYRSAGGQQTESGSRTDDYDTWGGGIGYRIGKFSRIGLNADHYRRRSDRDLRDYQGLRVGMAATYGF